MSAGRISPSALPRRWLHRLYEIAALGFGLGLLGALSLAWSLLALPLYYVLPKRWAVPLGRWASTTGFRIYLGALSLIGACRFDLAALDSLRDQGPLIVAPNHPCLLDAVMVISRLPNMACIMKVDIVDNVFLGVGARLAGYIRNDAQLSMIKQSVAELKSGSQLLIFPEGTRTPRGGQGVYKYGAARLAQAAGVPIVPIAMNSARCWPRRSFLLRPGLVDVVIGPPIVTAGRAPEDVTREVEQWIEAEMRRLDPEAYGSAS